MKNFVLALGAISAFAVAQANAQTVITDTDGNGVYSMEELVAAYPELTEENFKAADTNADGAVDADELAAAIEAGHIPA
ncbi:MAG: EF-hand domain-containing protein [Pseudorhodobacter sp.]